MQQHRKGGSDLVDKHGSLYLRGLLMEHVKVRRLGNVCATHSYNGEVQCASRGIFDVITT